jgi:hypothetical protein
MENLGESFLHSKNPSLHNAPPIEHEFKRQLSADKNVSRKPADKIAAWMRVLERTHMGHRDNPEVLERIRKYYHNQYVIKPEDIPNTYYINQQQAARELGHGNVEFTPEMRKQAETVIINDQESSLDTWLDYLISEENDSIPMWAKYWAFYGMVKLSPFDKENGKFLKRTNNTYAPFPELNREALARVLEAIIKEANKEQIPINEGNVKFIKLLADGNFGVLYAEALKQSIRIKEIDPDKTQGEWIKYNQGSDHTPLVNSLQGFATGWCTAASATAKKQLRKGDFYVYYTDDVPRLAIRMNGGEIAEVRGVAKDQSVESIMVVPPGEGELSVLDAKLMEFGIKGEKYKKRSKDMRLLTEIEQKYKNNEKLTIEDLKFLYQIDSIIEGFGYSKDPRIDEIIKNRNNKSDLSEITGFKEHEISTNQDEALAGGIKYHYGNLSLSGLTFAKGLTLPGSIGGSLSLKGLKSTEGLTLPDSIGGDLFLEGLKSTEGLTLPDFIGGSLFLNGLKSTEGLTLPGSIRGSLFLNGLTSAKGVTFPDSIGRSLFLKGLKSTEGLTLPDSIGGSLFLDGLTSAEKDSLRNKHPNLERNIY